MIAVVASAPHYIDHLGPVHRALDAAIRGPFLVPHALVEHALRAGIAAVGVNGFAEARACIADCAGVVVASYGDLRDIRGAGVPVIYMEHGAGQSYGGDPRTAGHPAFAGARDRRGVALFLTPGPAASGPNRAAHPDIPLVEVGVPKLDRRHTERRVSPLGETPLVAITWHWPCKIAPETMWAYPHYITHIGKLAEARGFRLLGHGHPRAGRAVFDAYRHFGVEVARDLDDVFDRADLLAADNTSALYEFASLGRPVVVLNAPWYRRDIAHGLRFWDGASVGLQVDRPVSLVATVRRALTDPPEVRAARERAVALAYAITDGSAATRAAAAIADWLTERNASWDNEDHAPRRRRSSAHAARRARAASATTSRSPRRSTPTT